jgi:hypothetical protein
MFATVIALQLVVAQASASDAPPPPPPAVEAPLPDRPGAGASAMPPAEAGARDAETGREPAAAAEDEDALKSAREPTRASLRARRTPKSALVPIPSLLSAEPLGGRSALTVWAGWSSLGAGWAQGVTDEDDLGVLGDLDWSTSELRVSAFYRRPMGRVGLFAIGARMRAGWYADFGAKWFHDDNMGDRGVEVVPGLVISARGAGGVFSLCGDLPIVVTLWRDGGIFAAPKATLAYETLLYGDLTVGVRVAGAYRAGAGDAPMTEPRALLDLQVLAGWKLF